MEASGKHSLYLTSLYVGGCTFERHWQLYQQAEKDPEYKPYPTDIWKSGEKKSPRKYTDLKSMLKAEKWDIVTIQQGSHLSWRPASYQPYAGNLIKVVKEFAPQAEIVVQQTWSYRNDSKRLVSWKIDQNTMYRKLAAAYAKLADENGFRTIPTGYAVQVFRKNSPVKYQPVPAEKLAGYKRPAAPPNTGDVVGKNFWGRNRKTKKPQLTIDSSHLNNEGEYLQACVWYAVLFGENPEDIRYNGRKIKAAQAKFLRECAAEAVKTFPGKK